MSATPADHAHPRGTTRLLGRAAAWLLRVLGTTWRVRVTGHDPFAAGELPVLGALLHRDFLVSAWFFRDRGISVGVSASRDGDLIDAALGALGYAKAARGSSSRGGAVAQLSLLHSLEDGRSVAVVVDGPRGPAGRPKPGIARLARRTGRAITPFSCRARFAWVFGSWDAACLPLPFARVECRFGESVPSDSPEQADDEPSMLRDLASRLEPASPRP